MTFLIIKKTDINSILPITINKIIDNFDDVNKSEKSISSKPYKLEFTVFVIVKIDNLKELSKLMPPADNELDSKKMLIKKQMKIKKDEFIFSLLILCSVFKIDWSRTILGETSLKISKTEDLKSMYILINLIPEEFEMIDPPMIVKKIKNK